MKNPNETVTKTKKEAKHFQIKDTKRKWKTQPHKLVYSSDCLFPSTRVWWIYITYMHLQGVATLTSFTHL